MKFSALTLLGGLLIGGCSQEAPWDKALVCSGIEQVGPTHSVSIKPRLPYRISVDVRQRGGQIYLKSLSATPWPGSDGKVHFQSKFAGGWMAGQLDETTGTMNLILERHLNIEGADQATRTVGEYACVAASGPLLKGQSATPSL